MANLSRYPSAPRGCSPARRTAPLFGLMLVAATLGGAHSASAQTEAHLALLGFNEDMTQVLVRMEDPNQGVLIQIRDLETGKVKKGWFAENRNDELKKVKDLRKKTFKVAAVIDQMDPDGRYTAFGAPDAKKENYEILVMRDGRVGVVGAVPLKREEARKRVAKAILKDVVWSADGKTIYCVVNQKIEREDGPEDVDDLHVFKFKGWKVKWIQAAQEPEEEGQSGSDDEGQ